MDIVEHLLANTWDEAHFETLFGTRINYIAENHAINHKTFGESLIYIEVSMSDANVSNKNSPIFSPFHQTTSGRRLDIFQHYFCVEPHHLVQLMYALKLQIQETTSLEEKMILLFHLCIVADRISDRLCANDPHDEKTVKFFVRDLLHFFGNLINGSDDMAELKLATCKYLLRFCKRILPAVVTHFAPFLNFVVSVLVSAVKKSDDESVTACCMESLQFLIDAQVGELRDAIAALDRFPSLAIFNALREIQDKIKYGNRTFSLVDEIEHFLSVEKRKIEGLIALKEHVSILTDPFFECDYSDVNCFS